MSATAATKSPPHWTPPIRAAIPTVIFGSALLIRICHMIIRGLDYYGDSYHHWLVSYLTATNGYAYTSFKEEMRIVWLPLYHYISAFLMNSTGIYDLTVPHAVNIISGSLTCVIVYSIAKNLSGREALGIAAASSLALQPWFVNLNTLALTETLSCLFIISAIHFYLLGKHMPFLASITLAMLTRYEAWFFAAVLLSLAAIQRKFGAKRLLASTICAGAVAIAWCLWSYANTNDLLAWYRIQTIMTGWDVRYFYGRTGPNFHRLANFINSMINMTSWLLPIGLAAGLLQRRAEVRAIAILESAFLLYLGAQILLGGSLPEPKYSIYVFPLTSILSVSPLGGLSLKSSHLKKALFAASLLLIVLLPLRDVWVFPVKTYVVKPELEAGLALATIYEGGGVISDSPAVIYYSRIDPRRFHPSSQIHWYAKGWSREKLKEWYIGNDIRYMVWQNASYSSLWWLYPELSGGRDRIDLTDPRIPIGYFVEYSKVHRFLDRSVAIHIYRIVVENPSHRLVAINSTMVSNNRAH